MGQSREEEDSWDCCFRRAITGAGKEVLARWDLLVWFWMRVLRS